MKVLIFVIVSVVFSNCFGKSQNNIVNSSMNLNADVDVLNDSIKKIREDFETFKRVIKSEYDNKIDAVNQENDGRFQVFQFLFGSIVTVLLFVIGYSRYEVSNFIKNDANDKIKFEVNNIFDDKFEKNKKQIEAILAEAILLLEKIKENESNSKLTNESIEDKINQIRAKK